LTTLVDPASERAANNASIAQALREMAVLLDAQGDNPFRVAAYRRAADTVARSTRPLREIHELAGLHGLDALPGVGPHIAVAIAELLSAGRWQQLERLRGSADPEWVFRTVPGIDPELAHRLHEELGVDNLPALAALARGGRLEALPGVGARRAAAIAAALSRMLDQRRGARAVTGPEPPVEMLLDVDREYRAAAQAGRLPKIAPKRFNPEAVAWLPVLHTGRPGWHVTALHSNTARAHDIDQAHDGVRLYCEDAQHNEWPYTVPTRW